MTTTVDRPGGEPTAAPTTSGQRRWWKRPWIGPLGLIAVAFIAYSLPPYLSLDPARSRVPAPAWFPLHFPVLVGHVVFGSIAMLTCCVQIWPWFRQRYQLVHRYAGRVYFFAGVLPSSLLAFTDSIATPFGPANAVGGVMLSTVWLSCTVAGVRMARQRRFVEHRRWMVRSFALTMSIILNRVFAVLNTILMTPHLATTFGGSEVALSQTIAATGAWVSWTSALLFAQWWLERGEAARHRARATRGHAAVRA